MPLESSSQSLAQSNWKCADCLVSVLLCRHGSTNHNVGPDKITMCTLWRALMGKLQYKHGREKLQSFGRSLKGMGGSVSWTQGSELFFLTLGMSDGICSRTIMHNFVPNNPMPKWNIEKCENYSENIETILQTINTCLCSWGESEPFICSWDRVCNCSGSVVPIYKHWKMQ